MLCVSWSLRRLWKSTAPESRTFYYKCRRRRNTLCGRGGVRKARTAQPEGVAVELADCMIRILTIAGTPELTLKRLYGSSTNTTKPAHIATAGRNVDRGSGRLVSPFANDPFALVALAFKNLLPEREYAAYFVPEVEDGSGGAACGVTTFRKTDHRPLWKYPEKSPLRRALRYLRTNWRMSPRRKIGSMAKRGRPPLTVF